MSVDSPAPARALVTGASGFVGRHLVAALRACGYAVCGSSRHPRPAGLAVDQWVQGDLAHSDVALSIVSVSRPTHVFHLAGVLGRTGAGRRAMLEANVLGTAALLEAVDTAAPSAWVCVAGSSAVYGRAAVQPIPESAPANPLTDYATSKAAEEIVAAQFRAAAGVTCCVLRLFNLVGPGQSDALLLSGLARQVAEQERDGPGIVRVGSLHPRRDYLDARDAVRAIAALAGRRCNEPHVNIGSGTSHSVQHCVDLLQRAATRPFHVEVDAGQERSVDVADQRADITLLRRLTGWAPAIDLAQSAADLLDDWRARVALGRGA